MEKDPVDLELVCRARVTMWLEANPLGPFNSAKTYESFQMGKVMVTYPNKLKIPLIKDVGIAAMKELLRNSKKVSEQV